MRGQPRRSKQAVAKLEPESGPVTTVESLVRGFVRQVSSVARSPANTAPGDDQVILDVEVDGVRCVLIRPHAAPHPQVSLSPREQEIARMVAKGYPNKTIGAVLDISSWTVCTHLRRIFAKLGVGSRAAMVAQLLQEGLIRDFRGHPEHAPPPK